MKDKIVDLIDKYLTNDAVLKRISFSLILVCVLLGLILAKLYDINENILSISKYCGTLKEESVSGDLVEHQFDYTDSLPYYEEIKDDSSMTTTQPNIETTSDNTSKEPETNKSTEAPTSNSSNAQKYDFVINVNSKKIHYADCTFVSRMKEENKQYIQLSDKELNDYLNNGYNLCSTCGG